MKILYTIYLHICLGAVLWLTGCQEVERAKNAPIKEQPSQAEPAPDVKTPPPDFPATLILQPETAPLEAKAIGSIYGDPADFTTPGLAFVGMVRDDMIEVAFNEGSYTPGEQLPYVQAEGDEYLYWMEGEEREHRWVRRNGKDYGIVVGKNKDIVRTFDQITGLWDSHDWLSHPGFYQLRSDDDTVFAEGVSPQRVMRKSKPTGSATVGINRKAATVRHTVYLELEDQLIPGAAYQLTIGGDQPVTVDFIYDEENQHSNAIHVNQLGFRPDDPSKLAFLSTWAGDGGAIEYDEGMAFTVMNSDSGEIAYEGEIELRLLRSDPDGDASARNYNKTDIHVMDFSALDVPGNYVVVVEGIGRSYPFTISADAWQVPYRTGMRGFLHQRSGIELDASVTNYVRPRNMHPDDPPVTITHTDAALVDVLVADTGMMSVFPVINDQRTDEVVTDFWGGYHDAGDWDRRTHHLYATRLKLELVDLFPEAFLGEDLRLPESGNGMPDILDEARWNLGAYGRTQTEAGGIRGGAESAEHPIAGEASWQESLPIMAFAPGIWASYLYAADASRMAHVLRKLKRDDELATAYETKARKAYAFAETIWNADKYDPMPFEVRDARNLAAAELFRLTGDARFHDSFAETLQIDAPGKSLAKWGTRKDNAGYDQADAAFTYLLTDQPGADDAIKATLRQAYLNQANRMVRLGQQTGFAWTVPDASAPLGWGRPATSQGVYLVRAHYLTGDERYLKAAIDTSLFGLGANPDNLVFTTGLGENPIRNPHHRDSYYTGVAAPAGISVYGPFDVERYYKQPGADKTVDPYIWPAWKDWPPTESHTDNYEIYMTNELTVHQTMGPNTYVWGYLHAR